MKKLARILLLISALLAGLQLGLYLTSSPNQTSTEDLINANGSEVSSQ